MAIPNVDAPPVLFANAGEPRPTTDPPIPRGSQMLGEGNENLSDAQTIAGADIVVSDSAVSLPKIIITPGKPMSATCHVVCGMWRLE